MTAVTRARQWPVLLAAVLLAMQAAEAQEAPTQLGRSQPARDYLYREYRGDHFSQAVRMAEWKAVRRRQALRSNCTI